MSQTSTSVVLFSEINSKFGLPFLQELVSHPKISVQGLVTSPRGEVCSYYVGEPDPVNLAEEGRSHSIPVFRPDDVNADELYGELSMLQTDYLIIANYQQLLGKRLLDIPNVETVNFHPSPLPRYAGRAPFFWMAKNGETDGGVSAIKTTPEIDAGPIIEQRSISLSGRETAWELRTKHFKESVRLLQDICDNFIEQDLDLVPQDLAKRTYYGKISDEDCRIDWNEDTETILRTIRAGYRRPGAFTHNKSGDKITILRADRTEPDMSVPSQPQPGTIHTHPNGVLIATGNGWIQIQSICVNGSEVEICSPTVYPPLQPRLASQPVPETEDTQQSS